LHITHNQEIDEDMKDNAVKIQSPYPSVDVILRQPMMQVAIEQYGRKLSTDSIRASLALLREKSPQETGPILPEAVAAICLEWLEVKSRPSLRPLINLTGTILHTNLGRAILPEVAVQAVMMAMRQAVNLEYDVATGKRGERDDHVRDLIREITGAEDCVIVNNNAAAVLLVLSSLSVGKETIVSRGELIEIGGSFRIPDIMRRAGAKLREVGTTNRTHLSDYEDAVSARTAAIMKVHTSNYVIQGFTKSVDAKELSTFARAQNLPIIDDLGSGTLVDLTRYGLNYERTVQGALREGADLVTFSGDKLLGGPQVGVIAGRRDLVKLCARNHLKRALRVDKLRMAALAATLQLYTDPDRLMESLPTLRLFTRPQSEMREMALRLKQPLQQALGGQWLVESINLKSQIGSGALPMETLPSAGLSMQLKSGKIGKELDRLSKAFRHLPLPVIGRIHDGRFLLDLRCLDSEAEFLAQLSHLKASQ
jgi:L-seryl-tRNA(Ser) seleniumtransferase